MQLSRTLSAALLFACAAASQDRRAAILERAKALEVFPAQQTGDATPQVLEEAGRIAAGTVYFYGRTPVEVGLKDIDWSGKHIQHQEWPAQLNRFFHLRQLAAAYRFTREERFSRAARAYIEDWIRGDPYETATTLRPGDNTLNMCIRLGTSVQAGWGGTLPVFLASPSFDDAFLDRIFASMGRQARFLSRRLTAAGNWRIAELDALVFTALRFPFLPESPELLRTGITGMRNALATQFLPDGVHIERTPGYHDWMTQVAANYLRLARLFPAADAGVRPDALARALDYGAQSELFGVNDSTAPHRDPATLSKLALRLDGAPGTPPLDQVFRDAGQVFSRTAWTPGADYLAFDASTWGGGHGHLSRLSFAFRSRGRMLVADPGILTYEMSDPFGPYGKSTAAHSTLNLGGRNQSGADAELLKTAFTPAVALIQARYQGAYWDGGYQWSFGAGRGNGAWGDHERILFWVKGEYLLAIDSMAADEGQEIRNVWQLGPMERWTHDANSFAWRSENPDANLLVQLVVPPAKTEMRCFEGSRAPLRGWVGWHGNDAAPAPLVEFRYPSHRGSAVVSVVLLASYAGQKPPRIAVKSQRAGFLELSLPDGSTDTLAWSLGLALPIDNGRPFVTDGTFVWLRTGATGEPVRHFTLGGSYLNFNGKRQ
ncbi:MAG: alginate lyase family protein [Acidobacteria bacterium]|nr:alginate lyase family protein [Acidobacteriota bacterium]